MDSSAATGPLVGLGVAGLGLLAVVLAAVLLLRRGRHTAADQAPAAQAPAASPPPPGFSVDDLAAFSARPPGFPGAVAPPAATGGPVLLAPAPVPRPAVQPAPDPAGRSAAGLPLALAALALVLVAASAAVALPTASADRARPTRTGSGAGAVVAPPLPAVPESPAAGQSGAGELAATALPLARGGTGVQVSFGGVVLEPHAVGATLTRPAAALTTSGGQALLHLRLPTWNCLSPELPDDPTSSGCVASVTEYGDLPSPALSAATDGNALVVRGRLPTYTRPNGSAAVYTGRVYDVTLTVHPGRRLAADRFLAVGTLTLGSGTARSTSDPAQDVLIRGR